MINNFGERLIDGFNNATDNVTNSPIKTLGALSVGIYSAIEGGHIGNRLMHDAAAPIIPAAKVGEVMLHVAEAIASGAGAVAGLLVGVGAGVLAMDALPGRRRS